MFLGGRKLEDLFCGLSLNTPKNSETSRPHPLLVCPGFCDPCFSQFSLIHWNTVLLMIVGQNWGYESRFSCIQSIISELEWLFVCLGGGIIKFFSALGDRKNCMSCYLLGDQYPGWHYDYDGQLISSFLFNPPPHCRSIPIFKAIFLNPPIKPI